MFYSVFLKKVLQLFSMCSLQCVCVLGGGARLVSRPLLPMLPIPSAHCYYEWNTWTHRGRFYTFFPKHFCAIIHFQNPLVSGQTTFCKYFLQKKLLLLHKFVFMKFFNIVFLFRILNLIFPSVLPFLFVESWIPTVHHGWSDSVAVQPRPVQRRHMYATDILYMIEPSSTRYFLFIL